MVKIKKNPNGDTITVAENVSYSEFQRANDMHKEDVRKVMFELAMKILDVGNSHDWTKKSEEQSFYNDFVSTINDGSDFTKKDWYNYHVTTERHHLLSKCPDDVNLIDVLEMIVDCTCAGLSRSGKVRPLEIEDTILSKAINNTQEYIKNIIEVEN